MKEESNYTLNITHKTIVIDGDTYIMHKQINEHTNKYTNLKQRTHKVNIHGIDYHELTSKIKNGRETETPHQKATQQKCSLKNNG
jgi:hypothetical protein